MQRHENGTYEASSVGGETVRAFVPRALPPIPPIEMDAALSRTMERALLACGRLDSVSTLLPDAGIFLYSYVRREAVLSSQIEGTQSSLSDLLLFELDEAPGVPFDDVVEVSNYVAAMQHGLNRMAAGFPLSNRLIKEIHERLMSGGRGSDRMPGEFRRSQNWIGGTRPGNAEFVPPPAAMVEHCMSDLEKFLHRDDVPTLVKAALAHVQFETIHPFLDGNGRTGRLLIALIFQNEGVLRQPLLYLSLYLKQHRAEYYRLLGIVRTTGDWEQWLSFFLEGVEQTSAGAVETAHRLLSRFNTDNVAIRTNGLKLGSVLRVHSALQARPIATIDRICEMSAMTFPTASKAIEVLMNLGIVREITGKQRNRVYAYHNFLSILNEGAEPFTR
ncbi:MAG: Fic family protein [Ignavibacteria bacterium]|nr:Fic family protein [Ignavibacteria bacterium]MBK6420262.1 Fic family protein [Ignavibacteria bacterium]MBK7187015.1 Fic family protein [Ignavibacteria bacterium]MBK7412788.1 Fic family protein [Ignavibacteria bacterium]MBK9182138.1 Fic family protein [Ignavibacteria bacterium]